MRLNKKSSAGGTFVGKCGIVRYMSRNPRISSHQFRSSATAAQMDFPSGRLEFSTSPLACGHRDLGGGNIP